MHKTDWFHEKKWGVFMHYLHQVYNNPESLHNMGKGETNWDECIGEFDVELFAKQLADVKAGYLMLTLTQSTKYFLAPNETFDTISGYKPGEACAKTDFVLKMYEALSKYNIDLFLYFTGDGPSLDPIARGAFGAIRHGVEGERVNTEFVKKWASVAEEFSKRYGDKIKGWWLDGCYENIGYDLEKLTIMANAMRAGNPDALIASNFYGCMDEYAVLFEHVRKGPSVDDYAAGEMVEFKDVPYAPFVGKTRWHILSFLGDAKNGIKYDGWAKPDSKYSGEYMHDYVENVYNLGGVVTMDICVYRDGHIDPVQLEVLSHLEGGK